jgi:hypothetical protein
VRRDAQRLDRVPCYTAELCVAAAWESSGDGTTGVDPSSEALYICPCSSSQIMREKLVIPSNRLLISDPLKPQKMLATERNLLPSALTF